MPDTDAERELVLDAERRLQAAQRAGDVDALDLLLDDRLVATGPDGGSFGKADDLEAHRSGALRITKLVQEDLDLLLDGDVAITRVTVSAEAVQGGVRTAGRLRYTRTWVRRDDGWRVLGAHLSVLP
ncbi:MAG TPA: nuclear transport factor 2 family protein [Solirubrobacteraceae bacterium]|nr:nuclear transport factor 2 family protein [Solirubrobacteraceae bacterium]